MKEGSSDFPGQTQTVIKQTVHTQTTGVKIYFQTLLYSNYF